MLSFGFSKTATSTRISAEANARVGLLLGSDAGEWADQCKLCVMEKTAQMCHAHKLNEI